MYKMKKQTILVVRGLVIPLKSLKVDIHGLNPPSDIFSKLLSFHHSQISWIFFYFCHLIAYSMNTKSKANQFKANIIIAKIDTQ